MTAAAQVTEYKDGLIGCQAVDARCAGAELNEYLTPPAVCSSVEAYSICQQFQHVHTPLLTRHL